MFPLFALAQMECNRRDFPIIFLLPQIQTVTCGCCWSESRVANALATTTCSNKEMATCTQVIRLRCQVWAWNLSFAEITRPQKLETSEPLMIYFIILELNIVADKFPAANAAISNISYIFILLGDSSSPMMIIIAVYIITRLLLKV